ncbi:MULTISPECIES: glycine betaine ABC transporter substrate-binding protein [Bacillus]|uniref:glycine betaine ABC transporter substrate-binding protein n=1 Tax=Bacillus TaxID=1386 RepID=UPI000C78E545|nr:MULTISPECIES: glycine betaine ABC transporter substrate-binding protein [Bacillus]PLR85704.1 glycine/betaine ABC transporter substrate-binding protein [Bacillus sp. V33-4]RSK52841.1 glycine/betaine ABC transporter substrate-binding protein [Bacillus canaveralius]
MKTRLLMCVSLMLMIGVLSACNNSGDSGDKIVISGKMWTEQYILPHILSEYIKAHTDYDVEVEDGLGEVSILTPAMEKGDIDMYVEYTGTGLEAVLKEKAEPGESADDIFERVKTGYQEKYDIVWLEPLGFENTYTLAYTKDKNIAAENFSDLVPYSKDLSFGAPHQFYEREDGYDAMVAAYNFEFKDQKSFDPNIMYEAVKEGEVDVIPAFTTDGRIARYDLASLKDDKGFFPPYYAAPIVRQEVLDEFPELEKVVNGLAGKISEAEMAEMNAKVDIDKEDPEQVAKDFLIEKGLITE